MPEIKIDSNDQTSFCAPCDGTGTRITGAICPNCLGTGNREQQTKATLEATQQLRRFADELYGTGYLGRSDRLRGIASEVDAEIERLRAENAALHRDLTAEQQTRLMRSGQGTFGGTKR